MLPEGLPFSQIRKKRKINADELWVNFRVRPSSQNTNRKARWYDNIGEINLGILV